MFAPGLMVARKIRKDLQLRFDVEHLKEAANLFKNLATYFFGTNLPATVAPSLHPLESRRRRTKGSEVKIYESELVSA